MSRDAFLRALTDCIDRAELALDRTGGVLADGDREALRRDLRDLLAEEAAAGFLQAAELAFPEDELRERLRDLVLDELPDFRERLPEAPAPLEDPAALVRVLVLREVVLPELDVPLPTPLPPPPPVGKAQPMLSLAPLRAVLGVAVLVGVGLWQLPGPRVPRAPGSVLAQIESEHEVATRLPMLLRLPDGTEVAPRSLHVEAEVAGPLLEGVTTLRFPEGLDLRGGAVVEAIPLRDTRVVGFSWEGEAPVLAEEVPVPAYDRRRRSPPADDLWSTWRRRAALPPPQQEAQPAVRIVWRGRVPAQLPSMLTYPLGGLPPLEAIDFQVRPRRAERPAVPGWLEEGTPPEPAAPLRKRWEAVERPGMLRFSLRPTSEGPGLGLWTWGPRQVVLRPAPERDLLPRFEWWIDASSRGAPLAAARLARLRALASWTRETRGEDFPARRLGPAGEPSGATLAGLVADLEAGGFVGAPWDQGAPPPAPGVRRIVVLQGPGVTEAELAAAAATGDVLVLGQAVDEARIPGTATVLGIELVREPESMARSVWDRLTRSSPSPLSLAAHSGPESLLGAPVRHGPAPSQLPEPPLHELAATGTLVAVRTPGPCEPREPAGHAETEAQEPELIFGSRRQDPARARGMQVLTARPEWARRDLRPRVLAPPAPRTTDRYTWDQALQAPRVAGRWDQVLARAEAWRRVDPRNPWPLLYLAEAAAAGGDLARMRRALGGAAYLGDEAGIRRAAYALALGAGDPEAVRAARPDAPDALTRRLDEARAQVVLRGPAAAREAYQALVEEAYVQSLAGTAPEGFVAAARAEASVVAAQAEGRRGPGLFASLEPAGGADCLRLLLLDRAGEEVHGVEGMSRGGGRLVAGVAGAAGWARMRGPDDEVVLGIQAGARGPDAVARGALVQLRPGRPGFDARLVVAGRGPARSIHRERFGSGEESR